MGVCEVQWEVFREEEGAGAIKCTKGGVDHVFRDVSFFSLSKKSLKMSGLRFSSRFSLNKIGV
jgi:hypothetical protein